VRYAGIALVPDLTSHQQVPLTGEVLVALVVLTLSVAAFIADRALNLREKQLRAQAAARKAKKEACAAKRAAEASVKSPASATATSS
jgi:hypothetical protein